MTDLYMEIIGERNLIRNLDLMPAAVQEVIHAKLESWAERTADVVVENIEARLKTKTGKLASSVEHLVRKEGSTYQAVVQIDTTKVPYAKAQEGGAIIPPHMIYPKGRLLSFISSMGDKVVSTYVRHPGAIIPGAYFMRDAKRQMTPKLSLELKKELVNAIRANMRNGGAQ